MDRSGWRYCWVHVKFMFPQPILTMLFGSPSGCFDVPSPGRTGADACAVAARSIAALMLAVGPLMSGVLSAQSTTLRGRAFDGYSQAPIAGVSVTPAGGQAVFTGADGRFAVPCTGPLTLTIRRSGYEPLVTRAAGCGDFVQAALTPGAQTLNEVTVVETRDAPGTVSLSQPMSVSTIGRTELRRSTGLFVDDAFNLLPGVRLD